MNNPEIAARVQQMVDVVNNITRDAAVLKNRLALYQNTLEQIARIDTVMEDGGGYKFERLDHNGDWMHPPITRNPDEAMLEVIRLARATLNHNK
jgi:hypothetical protein